jgi:SNF2 family DNA or RNA helicase
MPKVTKKSKDAESTPMAESQNEQAKSSSTELHDEDECYLIYDMKCNSHSYHNPHTKDITPSYLFRDVMHKEGTSYASGRDAYLRHCDIFRDTNHLIPEDPNDEHGIITLHIFEYSNESNLDVIATIVSFDIAKITAYYKKHKTVPNMEFIKKTCIYHISYRNSTTTYNTNPTTLVDDIVKKVMEPSKDIMGPIIEHPEFMNDSKPLFDYQRRTIHWMLKTERDLKRIYYGNNYKYEIKIGPLIFDPISKKLVMQDSRDYIQFRGGALIDEVGLGKTIQTLTCSLMNPLPANQLSFVTTGADGKKRIKSRATLVLSPNHLAPQWDREIKAMMKKKDVRVIKLLTKNHYDKLTYLDFLLADFIFVSYNFVANNCFTKVYIDRGVTKSKSYCKSADWSQQTVQNMFDEIREEKVKSISFLTEKNVIFPIIDYHRIVVDEIHEPYVVAKYKAVANIMPILVGTYKWGVSGTPFDKGTMCFNKILDFTTNQQNGLGDAIVQIKDINSHMSNNFFRRNSKKSVKDEHTLPPLTEKIIWSKFSRTERMMYNAYKSDPNVAKDSVIIRQICCHPKIADEIKGILNNCKTLEDIEKSMVEHYRKQYDNALDGVAKATKSIMKTERRILIARWKQMRRFLKREGYKVTIDLPSFKYERDNGMNLDEEDNDDDDSSDSDDDGKIEFIVCEDTMPQVATLIGNKLRKNPLQTVKTQQEILDQQKQRLVEAERVCKGKKSSYDFFNNMLGKIKKATDKSKKKYEKARKADIRKAEDSDSDDSSDSDSSSDISSDSSDYSDDESEDPSDNCMVCLGEISGEDVGVTKCGHLYCYECIKQTVNSIGKCPACMNPLSLRTEGDIQLISFEKPVFDAGNSEVLKNKLELINKVGTKLTNLIYYLKSIKEKVIIFSQWDSLLMKVGEVLREYGIRTAFCKGSVWARDKAVRDFSDESLNTQVIMLSSKSAASGTNLTQAKKVILLDPISGDYEYRRNMEWQAVGRAYRMGQNSPVEIVRFIIKDTIEEDIYLENKKQDVAQKTQRNISETTDETITLSDDKLSDLSNAAKVAAELKKQKEDEKEAKRKVRIAEFKKKTAIAQKPTKVASKGATKKTATKAASKGKKKVVRADK